jgi:fumarate reductase subunit C
MGTLRHSDTTLWYVQVITGFSLFFLVSAHLYIVFTQPENIGPYASADRIWSQRFWILYALLLVAVHVHAGIGIYRLAIKWAPLPSGNLQVLRVRLKVAIWCIIVFFITLGTVTLVTYMNIGFDHAERAGERFVPATENQQTGH